jgi:hypothetical protein
MITIEEFQAALTGLSQVLPMSRQMTAPALVIAWDTTPITAKQQLTPQSLAFAVSQRAMDPNPPKEVPLHLSLLRYLYPLRNDYADVERGLRPDLAQRMAQPDRFHDPAPARDEHAPASARRLAASGFWHPSMLTPEQLRTHVQKVAEQVERVRAQGDPGTHMTSAQEGTARMLFTKALQGFMPLRHDNLAALWVLRNRKWADEMIQEAMAAHPSDLPSSQVAVSQLMGGLAKW